MEYREEKIGQRDIRFNFQEYEQLIFRFHNVMPDHRDGTVFIQPRYFAFLIQLFHRAVHASRNVSKSLIKAHYFKLRLNGEKILNDIVNFNEIKTCLRLVCLYTIYTV